MVSFIHPSFPTRHLGVARVESALDSLRSTRLSFDKTKGLSGMLLAAMVSALVVVADQLVDTWADGHLLAAWVAAWMIGFTALALFSGAARNLVTGVIRAVNGWSERLAKARADERLWAFAQSDPRVMADLMAAISRSER